MDVSVGWGKGPGTSKEGFLARSVYIYVKDLQIKR